MKPFPLYIFTLIIFIFVTSPALATHYSFSVCGTGDSQILLEKLADSFQTTHPDISINIPDSVGSSGGIRKVESGECELGRVARNFNEKELKYNLKYQLFAYSAVVFIANENIVLDSISTGQITSIFSGRAANLENIGGRNAPIYIVKRERGDSSRTVLEKNIPALAKLPLWAGKTLYTTADAVKAVELHQNTISFAPLAMTEAQGVQILKYNGVEPSPQNIRSGKYPLVVHLGLVWKGDLAQPVQDFFDFVLSPSARKIISANGAVPAK